MGAYCKRVPKIIAELMHCQYCIIVAGLLKIVLLKIVVLKIDGYF